MISIQPILTLFLTLTMELNLAACGSEAAAQSASETPPPPAQAQEMPELAPPPASSQAELKVTQGTQTYRGFQMDNVLHAPEGDIRIFHKRDANRFVHIAWMRTSRFCG